MEKARRFSHIHSLRALEGNRGTFIGVGLIHDDEEPSSRAKLVADSRQRSGTGFLEVDIRIYCRDFDAVKIPPSHPTTFKYP